MAIDTNKPSKNSIDPRMYIGIISLTIANLDQALEFYGSVLGLAVLNRTEQTAIVGTATGVPLITLVVPESLQARPEHAAGLEHFAILVPSRLELARLQVHISQVNYPLEMVVDHLVNESLYLYDPDGNHIEVYRDRSTEEQRQHAGRPLASRQLVNELLKEQQQHPQSWQGIHPQTRIGHLLLQVGDLQKAEQFYQDVLGFAVTMRIPGATFVSAGGYHHHIGLTIWESLNGPQAPRDASGLRFFAIHLPDELTVQAVVARLQQANIPFAKHGESISFFDPSHNEVILTYGTGISLDEAQALMRVQKHREEPDVSLS